MLLLSLAEAIPGITWQYLEIPDNTLNNANQYLVIQAIPLEVKKAKSEKKTFFISFQKYVFTCLH